MKTTVCKAWNFDGPWEVQAEREQPVFDATLEGYFDMPGRERQQLTIAVRKQVGYSVAGGAWWRIQNVANTLKAVFPDLATTLFDALLSQTKANDAAIFAAYQYGIHVGEARAAGTKPGPFPS